MLRTDKELEMQIWGVYTVSLLSACKLAALTTVFELVWKAKSRTQSTNFKLKLNSIILVTRSMDRQTYKLEYNHELSMN